jgi:hypothetical protein
LAPPKKTNLKIKKIWLTKKQDKTKNSIFENKKNKLTKTARKKKQIQQKNSKKNLISKK